MSSYPSCGRFVRALNAAVAGLAALALTVPGMLVPRSAAADTEISCESRERNRNFCRVDTRGGVYLQTQLSKAGCHKNSTWGYDDRGIWVSNGCRAVFRLGSDRYRNDHHDTHEDSQAAAALAGLALLAVGAAVAHDKHEDRQRQQYRNDYYRYQPTENDAYYYRNRGQRNIIVNCDSQGDRYNYCHAPVHRSHVRLLRRHSRASCEFHRDWGYNSSGIWVENGCRATFEIE